MRNESLRNPQMQMLRQVRICLAFLGFGLALSGLTAIPLKSEVDLLVSTTHADKLATASPDGSAVTWASWLVRVRDALQDVEQNHRFLAYGTDWLAFGHLVIALGFLGAWRDPVRNRWLFDWGLLACVLVIPWALAFGAIRGIPLWWRLIDCSFGVFGALPLWLARSATLEMGRRGQRTQ